MRIVCKVCSQIGYLQQLGNYFRVRHYAGIDPETGKAKFYYHQQTKEYVETQLALIEKQGSLKQQPLEQLNNVDQSNLKDLSSISSGRSLVWLGLQPPTLTTRVQIPATAPYFKQYEKGLSVLCLFQVRRLIMRGLSHEVS